MPLEATTGNVGAGTVLQESNSGVVVGAIREITTCFG